MAKSENNSFSDLEKRQMKTISNLQELVRELRFDIVQNNNDKKNLQSKINLLTKEKEKTEEKYRDIELQLKSKNYKIHKANNCINKAKEKVGLNEFLYLGEIKKILEDKDE